jgi:hypothetical protein
MGMNRTFTAAVAALVFAVGFAGSLVEPSFADGVLFTCTGTKGHVIRAAGKSFVPKPKAAEIVLLPVDDAIRTVQLWVRSDDTWDIGVIRSAGSKDVSFTYGAVGCPVRLHQPLTLNMLFIVECEYHSMTFLFLDQERGTRLIATELSTPMPTLDGSVNEATASVYTATCRDGKKPTP